MPATISGNEKNGKDVGILTYSITSGEVLFLALLFLHSVR